MINESLLDAPDALTRADPRGLLRAVAASGAQVRTAARAAVESGIAGLRPEGRPSSLLLAGPGPEVPLTARLLDALVDDSVRVTRLAPGGPVADPGALRWHLPRWAGPMDVVLVTSADGSEPGLTELVDRAYQHGCAVVSVAPAGAPVSDAVAHRHSLAVPLTAAPHQEPADHPAAPGLPWALLTPVLLLAHRLGLCAADSDALNAMADRLDGLAERCGPTAPLPDNPAKALAVEVDGSLPLLWSEGPLAHVAAPHAAATFTGLSGVPALSAPLPEAMAVHGALLTAPLGGTGDPDDIFRDRVDEPPALHASVLLLEGTLPASGGSVPPSAAPAARVMARDQGVALHELTAAPGSDPLEAVAELVAQLDFTAVYLALTDRGRR